MSLYRQLTKNTIIQILGNYAIGSMMDFRPLTGGSGNTNYHIRTESGEYVLTICDYKSLEESQALASFLTYLKEEGFVSTKIIHSKTGKKTVFFNNTAVLLRDYLRGEVRKNINKKILFKLGTSIGRLHQIPPPVYLPSSFSYGQQCFEELFNKKINHPFIEWLSVKHEYIKEHLHSDLPRSLIHGDIFYSNVVITENEIPVIIDYEEACYYYRIFDLGMAIIGLCCENKIINLSKAGQLLEGYQQVVHLTSLEKQELKAFIVYAAVATAFWRFRQFNIIFPVKHLKNSFEEMKEIADQAMSLPGKNFF